MSQDMKIKIIQTPIVFYVVLATNNLKIMSSKNHKML